MEKERLAPQYSQALLEDCIFCLLAFNNQPSRHDPMYLRT